MEIPQDRRASDQNNSNGLFTESKVRSVLKNDLTILLSIAIGAYGFIAMVILPLQSATQRIDVIETNHLRHIQDDIAEIKEGLKDNSQHDIEVDKKLERILTILEAANK